jgi:TolA-binding protein
MNTWLKISLYGIFGILAVIFGFQTMDAYRQASESGKAPAALRMAELHEELEGSNEINRATNDVSVAETSQTPVDEKLVDSSVSKETPDGAKGDDPAISEAGESAKVDEADSTKKSDKSGIATKAGLFFLSLVALALLIARDIAEWFAGRAVKTLSNDEDDLAIDNTYEEAEKLWANGEPIQAVEMFRVYLKKFPKNVHANFRIAEIYEKDLNNFVAAALEYEDLLAKNLPRERWGWAAIHLCNLYTGKLNQPEKGLELLRRVRDEYGDTPAGEKASARLLQIE